MATSDWWTRRTKAFARMSVILERITVATVEELDEMENVTLKEMKEKYPLLEPFRQQLLDAAKVRRATL